MREKIHLDIGRMEITKMVRMVLIFIALVVAVALCQTFCDCVNIRSQFKSPMVSCNSYCVSNHEIPSKQLYGVSIISY